MSTPAGWYSDPERAGHNRYWDGSEWGVTDDDYHRHHDAEAPRQAGEPASVEVGPQLADEGSVTPRSEVDAGGGLRRLQCDLCNGTEFTKEEDFFVCDFCRTKYSPATARRMMIQGTVEVAGTVQVDRASDAANLILLSKTAIANGNAAESYDYANQALQIDATSWEAWRCRGAAAYGMATFADYRIGDILGAIDSALKFAPSDRRNEFQQEWAGELREQATALYIASVNNLNEWLTWNSHVGRSVEVLRLLDKSYDLSPRPETLRDSIQVAVHLLEGFRYKDDGHWDAVNLSPQLEDAMRSVLAEKSRELQRFDPSYVPPQPKRARWLSFRRNPNYD